MNETNFLAAIHNYQCFKVSSFVRKCGWVDKQNILKIEIRFSNPKPFGRVVFGSCQLLSTRRLQDILSGKGGHTSRINIVFLLFNKSVNLQSVLICIWGQPDQYFPDRNWGWVGGCKKFGTKIEILKR